MHRLDPLLRPASLAVLGASERRGSVGRRTLHNLLEGGYSGRLFPVNPGRREVLGLPCHASLEQLPEPVEHVVFCIADHRVEAALEEAITHGARAVTIMSSLVLENDSEPTLRQRVRRRVAEAGLLVCGANGMGFYNFHDGVWACGFDTRPNHRRGGNVSLISHSGAGMSGIVDCEERLDFNLAVSTGQELTVGMHDYLDFALELPGTRAVGLFMETARDPEGLTRALDKARRRRIPVVALKVGRSERAAALTHSHSGALAGRDDAFQAVFDHLGVQRVQDMQELATALILFAQPHPVAPGGLAAIHDSGGERQLLIDLAEQHRVPLAEIGQSTVTRLQERLDPGLPPVNPLDAWGAGGPDADAVMEDCFAALMEDDATGLGAVVHDRAPLSRIYPEYIDYLKRGHDASGKPVVLVSNHPGSGSDPTAIEVTRAGFPVLDGLQPFLSALRCVFAYRDFLAREEDEPPAPVSADTVDRWRRKLSSDCTLDELEAGRLLSDFGLAVNPARRANSLEEALNAASGLGYPVVLKTLEAGLAHKTEHGAVVLDITGKPALESAYADLAMRLGPAVSVSPMITEPGCEMLLGMVRDAQFGPLVALGFGGIDVEALDDVVFALPPFGERTARRLVDRLSHRPLLNGGRSRPPADLAAFCRTAACFSRLVDQLGEVLQEIDINPLLVNASGCIAVDALVIGRRMGDKDNRRKNQ